MGEPEQDDHGTALDTSVPHIARVYDYWLGGKDNYAADRKAAEQVIATFPDVTVSVRAQRAFLGRAVHYLAAEAGIRQFLDIGTGLPSANNTHEVAQKVAPQARIVYVDNDPIVGQHGQAAPRRRARSRGPAATSRSRLPRSGTQRRRGLPPP